MARWYYWKVHPVIECLVMEAGLLIGNCELTITNLPNCDTILNQPVFIRHWEKRDITVLARCLRCVMRIWCVVVRCGDTVATQILVIWNVFDFPSYQASWSARTDSISKKPGKPGLCDCKVQNCLMLTQQIRGLKPPTRYIYIYYIYIYI